MQHNKAVNTDAQGRPLPSVAPVLGRGLLLRYASRNSGVRNALSQAS
jgi:hypothetical protein